MIAEEVDDEKTKGTAAENNSSSRKQVGRSTGLVDRPQHQEFGRPARSTDVHKRAQTCTSWSSVDRPVDRLEAPNSLLGTRSTDRLTGGRGRSTARSTDSRVRVIFADSKICYIYGCCWFLGLSIRIRI